MLLVVAMVCASANPPSPGRAVLDSLDGIGRRWLAEAPDADEEKSLEDDMAAARRKLGHADPAGDDAESARPSAAQDGAAGGAGASSGSGAARGAGAGAAGGAAVDGHGAAAGAADVAPGKASPAPEDDERPRRRTRKARVEAPAPTLDGHGKAYFLTWGIIDWVLAADFWGSSVGLGLMSLAFVGVANDQSIDWTSEPRGPRVLRQEAAVLGAVAVGSAVAGIVAAVRAGRNIGTFRELKAGRVP